MYEKAFRLLSTTISMVLMATVVSSCADNKEGVETPVEKEYTAGLKKPTATTAMTYENVPVSDGSDATLPLRQLLIANELGLEAEWEQDVNEIFPKWRIGPKEDAPLWYKLMPYTMKQSDTHTAFVECVNGSTDLIVTERGITPGESELAEAKGVEILSRAIAKDALTFVVHADNPVQNLSLEQVRKIYTGEITNWKEVGGNDAPIVPLVRESGSGTQVNMENLIMGGQTIPDRTDIQGQLCRDSESPYYTMVFSVEGANAIFYTPYYYYRYIVRNDKVDELGEAYAKGNHPSTKIKSLSLDGIAPSRETIASSEYPVITDVYASVRSDLDMSSVAYQLFYLLATGQRNKVIDESGYVTVNH